MGTPFSRAHFEREVGISRYKFPSDSEPEFLGNCEADLTVEERRFSAASSAKRRASAQRSS